METSTIEVLLPARDWFDFLVGSFTIMTGVILALSGTLAMVLAYAVQRARYLGDTEPDLRFGYGGQMRFASSRSGPWEFVMVFEIRNRSQHLATNVTLVPIVALMNIGTRSEQSISVIETNTPRAVLADATHTVTIRSGLSPTLSPGEYETSVRLSLQYSSPRHLVMWAFLPLQAGRRRLERVGTAKWTWSLPEDPSADRSIEGGLQEWEEH